jgi:fatty acid desaturase
MKLPRKSFLETKYLFFSTLAIIAIVILSVWISGKGDHRSLFQNSIVSTSILAGSFFLFITLGLYYGLKLKDNVGSILTQERIKRYSDKTPKIDTFDFDSPAVGDGIGGAILSVIVWIVFSIVLIFLLYFLGLFFWSSVLFLAAMLYWIFFPGIEIGI